MNEANLKELLKFFKSKMNESNEPVNNLDGVGMFLPSGKLNNK